MRVGEKVLTILLAVAAAMCAATPAIAKHHAALTETEAEALGAEVYIYGYPLVTMDMTRQVMTNSTTAEAFKAPMGQFSHARRYPDATSTDVTAPYFNKLALLLKENPPAAADAPMVAIMAQLGIVPGQEYDIAKFDKSVIEGLERAIKVGQEQILSSLISQDIAVNGWVIVLNNGEYGTNYLQRAAAAATGLGANLSQDAVYPKSSVDSNGDILSGGRSYVLHFTKEEIPPVKGFWSLTMYDDKYFFVPNDLHRYTLSPRNALKYNNDGSLDLYIQNSSPGKEKESNWLPAPEERFILMLRLYWPEAAVLDGTWKPPAVRRI